MTGTTYQDLSVSGQTTYYYVVQAVNATGVGAVSAEATATTPPPAVTFTQNLDIGTPQQAGSMQYAAGSGVYTVAGGGADIWGNSDSFHLDGLVLSGNASIQAQVTSVQDTSYAAKAGLMFRDSTSANAMMAMLAVTPGAGLMFETRTSTGGLVTAQLAPGLAAPIWLELSRTGNQFTAYYSTAGVPSGTNWIPLGSSVTVPMSSTPLVGLAVTAHAVSALNTSTFSGVSVSLSGDPSDSNPGVIQLAGGDHSIRIACAAGDANSVNVYVNSANSPVSTIPLSQVTQWQFLGGTGNDQVTVDFSNGDPLPAGGLSFAGGSGSGNNGLTIIGTGSADSVTLSPTQLTFDAVAPIVYANVQTVALSLSGARSSLAGSLAAGTSLVLEGSGSITPAAGFTQAGDLTVASGTIILNHSSDLASGAGLTVGAASAFDAPLAAVSASALAVASPRVACFHRAPMRSIGRRVSMLPAATNMPTRGRSALSLSYKFSGGRVKACHPIAEAISRSIPAASPNRAPADIHGAAIQAEVKAFDERREIDITWLAAVNDTFWPSSVDSLEIRSCGD